MPTRKDKKWRRFERLVARVQRELTPSASVSENERVRGRRTGELRQLDVVIRQQVGQFRLFAVIDCKDYKRKVNVKDVEAFMGLLDDVAATQGAIVAANGFSRTALKRAADQLIGTFTLVDAERHEWQTFLGVPMVAETVHLSQFAFAFRFASASVRTAVAALGDDVRRLVLYTRTGEELGCVLNLLAAAWEAGALPDSEGCHRGQEFTPTPVYARTAHGGSEVKPRADVWVKRRSYWQLVPLSQIRGLQDAAGGGVLARSFTTVPIDTRAIESDWTELAPGESPPHQALLAFRLKAGCPRCPEGENDSLIRSIS